MMMVAYNLAFSRVDWDRLNEIGAIPSEISGMEDVMRRKGADVSALHVHITAHKLGVIDEIRIRATAPL